MKETTVTERRITIEGESSVSRAEVRLNGIPGATGAVVYLHLEAHPASADLLAFCLLTAAQAAELERVCGRIREHLEAHERALALKDAAGAGSNNVEQSAGPPQG